MVSTSLPEPNHAAIKEWMQQWSDLEARLHVLLLTPTQQADFPRQLQALHQRMMHLLDMDADSTLYWLFQLAAASTVAYSASHAIICASLCHLVAPGLGFTPEQSSSLSLAALTMNVSMTRLQDDLAQQLAPLSDDQRHSVSAHAARSAQCLRALGVTDETWLHAVEHHHDADTAMGSMMHVLMATDRYAALLSPRQTRPGKCVTDSWRYVLIGDGKAIDAVAQALIKTVGICPPGTFVRLTDRRVAVVLRRTTRPGEPWVATVLDAHERPITEPELINTGDDGHGIDVALLTPSVRARLDHARLLQLSRSLATPPSH